MLDLIITVLFCWLFFKALGLTFRLTINGQLLV